ncbi:MAG: hypothetical protein ACI8P2_004739, partial [Candidatus Latescibacterota bacterium]
MQKSLAIVSSPGTLYHGAEAGTRTPTPEGT